MQTPSLDDRLAKTAKKLGLRPDRVRGALRALRTAASPQDHARRRRACRAFLAAHGRDDRLDEARGFAPLALDSLAGLAPAVEACARILDARRVEGRLVPPDGQKKEFLIDVLEPGDFEREPAIPDLVLGDDVLRIAASYLGTVPRLQTVQLWWTPPNATERSSQRFHLDQIDARQAKFIVNVSAVGPENGPFSCVAASPSARIVSRLGRRAFQRVADEEILREVPRAEVFEATGPPGSGVVVDSSRCFHFGGRAREGGRQVLMFHFTKHAAPNARSAEVTARLRPRARDDFRRLVVA